MTSNNSRRSSHWAMLSRSGRRPVCRTPKARPTSRPTNPGSRMRLRSTKRTPSTNNSSAISVAAIANRVLPTPPAPVSVTRRTSGLLRSATSAPSSRSRPMSGVGDRGRFRPCPSAVRSNDVMWVARRPAPAGERACGWSLVGRMPVLSAQAEYIQPLGWTDRAQRAAADSTGIANGIFGSGMGTLNARWTVGSLRPFQLRWGTPAGKKTSVPGPAS